MNGNCNRNYHEGKEKEDEMEIDSDKNENDESQKEILFNDDQAIDIFLNSLKQKILIIEYMILDKKFLMIILLLRKK